MTYRYLFITLHDNDFYTILESLGSLIVESLFDNLLNCVKDKDTLQKAILHLFYGLAIMGKTNLTLDYISNHLKVLNDPLEIKEMLEQYGMVDVYPYENPLLSDCEQLSCVSNRYFNSEALLIKLAYDHTGAYNRECSDWLVF